MLIKHLCKYIQIRKGVLNVRSCSNLAYIHKLGTKPLIYKNMGQQILRAVEKYGSQVAIKSSYEQRQLTYEESYEEAVILAAKLHDLGLQPGDHLAIWAPNTIQWYITFLAAAIGGFPLVCINPALQAPELKYALEKAKVKLLITMDSYGKLDFLNTLEKLKRTQSNENAVPLTIMKTDKNIENILSYQELVKSPSQNIDQVKSQIKHIAPESPYLIQFTSGTTGQPKAALISHMNMVNMAVHFGRALKLNGDQRSVCLTVPMFHAFGLGILSSSIYYGSVLCLPSPTFNAAAALECIERDQCNLVVGTPTMFVDMLDTQSKLQKSMESLDVALMGGSACSPEIAMKTKDTFQLADMRIGYGQSEATAAVYATDGSESVENSLHSVGKLFEFGEAKIIDEDGNTLKFGEVGELCVRGWFTMMGYYEDEENTRKTLDRNGWLRTGDQFILETNGVARIQGRKKDVIIRGGENIFPKEIEDILDTHESILESQVIGVPDYRLGEEVCAYLRLKADAEPLSLDDITEFCKGKLAYFKIPKYLKIVIEFPKTTSGKIKKFKLQEMFAAEEAGEYMLKDREEKKNLQ